MVHYFKKAFLASFFLFFFTNSWSTVVLVQNINDSGAGSLRDIITNANAGDTVMMNVKGTITLTTPINVPRSVTILGAYPIHSTIDCINSSNAFVIAAGAGDLVTIQGFRLVNNVGGTSTIVNNNGATARIQDCLFENNSGLANGQCIYVGSTSAIEVYNCSFNTNFTSGNGCGIFVDASTTAYIRNCTFYSTGTSAQGGAIYNLGTNTSVTNNTFLNNSATGGGADIFNIGSIEFINNIVSNATPSASIQNTGSWINPSGNVFSGGGAGPYGGASINGPNTIFTNGQANIGIQTALVTDGYGLKYVRIAQQTSPCVDNGMSGTFLLATDCKRAPRIIFGDNALSPDVGAVEFTPFTVTSNTVGPNDLPSKWSVMNSAGYTGPRYMDFDMPGTGNFTPAGMLENFNLPAGEDWIVDGFTQPGSVIPGPGFSFSDVTVGTFRVNITQNTTTILYLSNAGPNSWISGLSLDNNGNNNHAIECDDASFKFLGNEIISTNASAPDPFKSGIFTFGIADCIVGGWRHHMRNVIGKQGRGLRCESNGMTVAGNFIGVSSNGLSVQENLVGVYCLGGNLRVKGKFRYPAMNVISGNTSEQILIDDLTFFEITGNIIGTDLSAANLLTTTAKGIQVLGNTDGYIGGIGPYDQNVIGGNIEGIHITASNAVDIHGNYIGICPEGTMPAIPNVDGIYIFQNGDGNHTIGDGTYAGRNYISGNSRFGIYLDATNGHTIDNNFIGLKPDNSALGNGNAGILIDNTASGMTIRKNIISGNTGEGIQINNAGSSDIIEFNYIGTDSTGMTARSNGSSGIWATNTGGLTNVRNNVISGNSFSGIELVNTPGVFMIENNIIGLDALETNIISNNQNGITMSNCSGHNILNNIISGNSANGIYLSNSNGINIDGNYIGTNSSNTNTIGNSINGIAFGGAVNNVGIGGTNTEANTIAFNGAAGVAVNTTATNVGILNNLIYDNANLGITLTYTTSPLANDIGDADAVGSVGNAGQNYPDNLVAANCSTGPSLAGDIECDQAGNYTLQVFRINPGAPDASGHGEGNEFITEVTLTLAAGNNTFSIPLPGTVVTNDILAVTSSFGTAPNFSTSEFSDTVIVQPQFTATASVTNNVLCFGGSDGVITATHGGPGPFFYNWYDNNTGLPIGQSTISATVPVGDYYLEISTTTCTANTNVISVTQPAAMTLTPTVTNVDCNGAANGSIDLTIAGGTGPYTHDWDNDGTGDFDDPEDLINIAGGTYFVSVIDFNGCTISDGPITVNEPSPLLGTAVTVTNETCDGADDGTITLSASGGTAGYMYQMDGGGFVATSAFTGLSDGVHNWDIQDANGCIFNSSTTINPGTSFIVNFSTGTSGSQCQNDPVFNASDVSICNGSTISNWAWTLPTGVPSSANGVSSLSNILFTNAGVNNVTLVVTSADGCMDSVTLPFTVNPQPIADAGLDFTICSGDAFTQNANVTSGTGPFNFNWQPDPGHFVDNTIEDPTILASLSSTPGVHTHIMNVSDVNGCVDADTMILTINALPTVDAGTPQSICQGSSTSLSGSGAATYVWDNSVIDGSPFTPSSTLLYTVTGTDAAGCMNTDTVTVSVTIPFTVNAGGDFNVCESDATLVLSGTSNSPSVTWTGGTGSYAPSPNTLSPVYTITGTDVSAGTITFTLATAANGACAAVSDNVIVTFDPQPMADAGTLPATSCNSTILNLTGTPTIATTYNWTSSGIGSFGTPTSVTTNYTPAGGETGLVTFFFTVDPVGTCPGHVDSVSTTLIDSPIANAGTDATICSGQTITLDGTSSTGTITNYSWDIAAGPNVGTTVVTSDAPTSTTNYVLTVDNGTCADDDTITITVVAAPDASFAYSATGYCQNNPNILPSSITTAGGMFSMPSAPTNINTTTGEVTFNLLSPGTHTIYYTLSTPCTAIDSFDIDVFTLPDATINGTVYLCVGSGAMTLNTNSTLFPVTTTTGGTFSGTGVGSGIFTPSTAGSGSHIITYSVTDGNGCSSSDTALIVVNPSPTVSISNVPPSVCQTDPVFTPVGSPAGGTWIYDAVGVGSSISVDPDTVSVGLHTFAYQYTDPTTGCSATSTPPTGFTVYAVPLDPTTTQATSQTVCAGTILSLTASNPNGAGTSLAWYTDVALTNQVASGPTFNTPALTNSVTYYVVVQNNGCKSNPIVFDITVNTAVVSAGPDIIICPNSPALLNVNTAVGTISWSPGATLDDSTIQNPSALPNVNTTYVVTVTNGTCVDSDSVNVIIDGSNPECGVVPSYNAFSPDGDGVNDTWVIDAAALHPNNHLTIFNRWGDKLVEFENYDNVTVVWDGTYKGNLLPSGTYYYVIEYLDINIQVSGWLQITH